MSEQRHTDTPRTDAQDLGWWVHPIRESCSVVPLDFARTLERENEALKEQVRELVSAVRWYHLATVNMINACNSEDLSEIHDAVKHLQAHARKVEHLARQDEPTPDSLLSKHQKGA